jgi:hypothetical protein
MMNKSTAICHNKIFVVGLYITLKSCDIHIKLKLIKKRSLKMKLLKYRNMGFRNRKKNMLYFTHLLQDVKLIIVKKKYRAAI